MSNYHISRIKGTTDWRVKREHTEKSAQIVDTQAKAEKIAKKMAHNTGGGEVVIHGWKGQIRDKDTIPNARDPFPPRDKKH